MPDNLGRLVNLRTLIVGLKTVKKVPEPILQLTRLESLAITFCRLAHLPAEIAAMRNLRALNVQGNPGLSVRPRYPRIITIGVPPLGLSVREAPHDVVCASPPPNMHRSQDASECLECLGACSACPLDHLNGSAQGQSLPLSANFSFLLLRSLIHW